MASMAHSLRLRRISSLTTESESDSTLKNDILFYSWLYSPNASDSSDASDTDEVSSAQIGTYLVSEYHYPLFSSIRVMQFDHLSLRRRSSQNETTTSGPLISSPVCLIYHSIQR